jgi:hypothetical protein
MKARAVDEQYSVERSDDRFRTLPMHSPIAFKAAYLQHFVPMNKIQSVPVDGICSITGASAYCEIRP